MQPFLVLIICLLVGFYSIYLGLQGYKDKLERELHGPAQQLPGFFEGTVQRGWWMFVINGIFVLIIGIIEIANSIKS